MLVARGWGSPNVRRVRHANLYCWVTIELVPSSGARNVPSSVPAGLTRSGTLMEAGLADMAVALRRAARSISIATPFLSRSVAGHLVRAADEGLAHRRRLLTALNDSAVAGGYLSIDAIEEFLAAQFEVRSLRNLHAKVLIVDSSWALIGSGNLTEGGVNGRNAELGIVLSPAQARDAERLYFRRWWRAAEPLDLSYMRKLRATEHRRRPIGNAAKDKVGSSNKTRRRSTRPQGADSRERLLAQDAVLLRGSCEGEPLGGPNLGLGQSQGETGRRQAARRANL
jgi:phosphatidylserine/phosphatidylglycerophosphate/cardiolipin synthase-like enzyme